MRSGKLNFVLGMALGGVLMAGGMVLGGMSQQPSDEASFSKLSVQELTLTGRRGKKEFLRLRSTETGGLISVLDRDGKEVMTLGVSRLVPPTGNDQPSEDEEITFTGAFDIHTSDDVLLVRSGGNTFGGFTMLNNVKGRNVVTMATQKSLGGIVAAHDLGGKPVALIVGTPRGGVLVSQDRRGNVLGRIP